MPDASSQPSLSEAAPRRLQGLNRYSYWRLPEINPWWAEVTEDWEIEAERDGAAVDERAHALLSKRARIRFEAGDADAIFKYAALDPWAFRAQWVVAQLEEWRRIGDSQRIRRLMTSYADLRGRTTRTELAKIVARDQKLFRRLIDAINQGTRVTDAVGNLAATRSDLDEESLQKILRAYRPFYRSVVPSRFTDEAFFAELALMVGRIRTGF